jgi:predicted nucleic acid-binding protein
MNDKSKISYNLKKKGKFVNLTHCYIAVIAQENRCRIFTLDEHFKDIQKSLNPVVAKRSV